MKHFTGHLTIIIDSFEIIQDVFSTTWECSWEFITDFKSSNKLQTIYFIYWETVKVRF